MNPTAAGNFQLRAGHLRLISLFCDGFVFLLARPIKPFGHPTFDKVRRSDVVNGPPRENRVTLGGIIYCSGRVQGHRICCQCCLLLFRLRAEVVDALVCRRDGSHVIRVVERLLRLRRHSCSAPALHAPRTNVSKPIAASLADLLNPISTILLPSDFEFERLSSLSCGPGSAQT